MQSITKANWGTHFCQFFHTKKDLTEILVPYFEGGLEKNDLCLWITSDPIKSKEAENALEKKVKNFDSYQKKGQIEIVEEKNFHKDTEELEENQVIEKLLKRENKAQNRGFNGLRLAVNTPSNEKKNQRKKVDYGALLNKLNGNHRMLSICSYDLDNCTPPEIIDIVSNHQFALIKKEGKWDIIENSDGKLVKNERRQSNKKLLRIFVETVNAMACAVEMRDPYTAGHQERVAELAGCIAEDIKLEDSQKNGIRMSGIIHDVGKIQIPQEILSKPGKLTEIEFSLIKTHPQVGYDILKTIEFPYPVSQIIFQHHERVDGSGYPEGLKGKEILMEARVLGVADVVEAMASHRPYRPALGIEKAFEEIIRNKGKLYDPIVVDSCLRVFKEKEFQFL